MGTIWDQINGSVWPWFVIWCSVSPHLWSEAGMLMCVHVWSEWLVCAHVNAWELACTRWSLLSIWRGKKKKKQAGGAVELIPSTHTHTHTHITILSGSSSFLMHNVPGQNPHQRTIEHSTIFSSESCGSIWQMQRDNYIYLVFCAMAGDAFLQLKWFFLSACVGLWPFYLHCCVRVSGYKLIVWKGLLNMALIFHAFPTQCRHSNH